ncbi:hypothetical protein VOLCADRAFT_120115, partial [Volvox carteri f. nagariensis]
AELFAAICTQKSLIWIRADLDLREEHWPADCKAPVELKSNMTISGPLDEPLYYTVSFNFMVVIPPYGEVRLRHFTARNTRRGGSGEVDFIAYSPKGILWTDDLNKNQEVLHYEQFFTDVNVGSDTETGGYVMAKRNASKTCDQFVTMECLQSKGGDACMMQVINDFLAKLSQKEEEKDGHVNPLAIALPAAFGGTALVLGVIIAATLLSRRRQRRRHKAEAAVGGADVETAGGGGGGKDAGSCSSHEPARYDTGGDMGRCLSGPGRRAAGHIPSLASPSAAAAALSSGAALVEGVMEDGSVCALAVATEIRLMTSEACRHPNLLRAHTYVNRAKVLNKQQPAGQALQSTIRSLAALTSSKRGGTSEPPGAVAAVAATGATACAPDLAETWIVSEYCDLGALSVHVHVAKSFLYPLLEGNTLPEAAATATATAITAATTSARSASGGGSGLGGGAACVSLRRPRLDLILRVLRDISSGMAHLHSLNIVHGDLKLGNVLLQSISADPQQQQQQQAEEEVAAALPPAGDTAAATATATATSASSNVNTSALLSRGREGGGGDSLPSQLMAKVADFGLSRCLKEGQTHHSTKTVGTVTHMPPELLRSGKLTLSGDVYSFGIMMWELLTGSVPYR